MSNVKKNYKEIEKNNNNNMNADVAQLERWSVVLFLNIYRYRYKLQTTT